MHDEEPCPAFLSLVDAAMAAAIKACYHIASTFVAYPLDSSNETIGFDGTVAVNNLNSTTNFTYYTTRPTVMNGLLGEGAFVLASLEVEKLQARRWKS